jgi:polar amino acid transport system substrate-binding protein
MNRIALFALALGALAAGTSLANARSLDQVLSAGELRVGVNPNYPPTALYDDKNELAGFDVDISNKLAGMLGVKLTLVIVDPASRIPFLTSDKVDITMAALTRTPDRAKLVDFSVPINTEGNAVLTTEDKPYKSPADLNDASVTFAEVRGTTPIPVIQQEFPNAKILQLADWPDAFRAVSDGRATAVVADASFFGEQIKTFPDVKWKLLPGTIGPVYWDCAGVNKGNDSLRNWLNVALYEMETSGFVDEAWKKWYHVEMATPVKPDPYF